MDKETEKLLFNSPDGLTIKKCGRKKGSKNKKKSLNEYALDFLETQDNDSFVVFWDRIKKGLEQHAYSIVPNNDDVDDIVANVLIKALTKYDQYNSDKAQFSTWLYTICKNEALAFKNNRTKRNIVDTDFEDIFDSKMVDATPTNFINEYDYSDKFDVSEEGEMFLMEAEDVRKKIFDTSVNEIKQFKDPRIVNCMLERFSIFDAEKRVPKKPLNLEQIAAKYNYPLSSVKNWVNKGRAQLKEVMLKKHFDLYEMWKEVL